LPQPSEDPSLQYWQLLVAAVTSGESSAGVVPHGKKPERERTSGAEGPEITTFGERADHVEPLA
jgi:hypothetical protein